MGCVILLISVLLKIRKKSITTTVYQVRNGNQTEWITQSEWLAQQKQLQQITNLGGYNNEHTTKKPSIEAIAILPISSYSTIDEKQWVN